MTRHTDLFWNVIFDKQVINGEAVLHFDIVAKEIERIVSMQCSALQFDIATFVDMNHSFFTGSNFITLFLCRFFLRV